MFTSSAAEPFLHLPTAVLPLPDHRQCRGSSPPGQLEVEAGFVFVLGMQASLSKRSALTLSGVRAANLKLIRMRLMPSHPSSFLFDLEAINFVLQHLILPTELLPSGLIICPLVTVLVVSWGALASVPIVTVSHNQAVLSHPCLFLPARRVVKTWPLTLH